MEVQAPPPPSCWSNVLKQQPPSQPQQKPQHQADFIAQKLVGSCSSTKGIAVAVVDANAIIQGGERLFHSADRFVSVAEVISEIRDPASRHALHFLPFTVDTLEPSPDALKKVVSFARATGDLQTLSDVDLKLIALTHTLESQIHGTQHLRDSPPPIHAVNIKRLPEKDLPGWGSNVPNLEEWEALDHAEDNGSHVNSRILPLKDLSLGVIPEGQTCTEDVSSQDGRSCAGNQENGDAVFGKPKRYYPKKSEVKIDGKKMVADGIDASLGQFDENSDDWRPAVSRSTHRRFLRRKARREMSDASSVQQDTSSNLENENLDDDACPELLVDESYEETVNGFCKDGKISTKENGNADISEGVNKMKLDEECSMSSQNVDRVNLPSPGDEFCGVEPMDSSSEVPREAHVEITDELGNLEMTSQTNEDADTWHTDDISSEQSWTLRSLSESSVACITADFAMQNVLLQMGLRLLAPGGMQIRELHRWVLKCHACSKVTTETGKIFCPTCGNGGTLRKVAVTVSDNGIVLAARRPRISLRGTKYSLPLPQGGRDAITKNPILREDQLPQKFLYPKTEKKNNQDDDFFIPDDVFLHHNDKKAPLQPPIRKALAVFKGKRNPNDIRYAPRKC
ncbi:RNA-binding NOB1-like protein [Salvia miltiorrhiza]|uniref:RNA-binding NOB1-like protein n=1 Tax=Salvia miltiorrhiza TaxID=226208 RepID=UPI0025AC2183|nr:RNA-binding NOB1-like protein [Salvia miltiorrhiza]XP_057764469.1 RNA-binding NOB1-like protein [Salvia miltiorrhiza]